MDIIDNVYILFLRYTAQCLNNCNIAESCSCVELNIYPKSRIKGTKALKILVRGNITTIIADIRCLKYTT